MSTKTHLIAVDRVYGTIPDTMIAIIRCRTHSPSLQRTPKVVEALREVITHWVNTTPQGAWAWENRKYSGILSSLEIIPFRDHFKKSMELILEAYGIYEFEVILISDIDPERLKDFTNMVNSDEILVGKNEQHA